jgi:hypothetical protein
MIIMGQRVGALCPDGCIRVPASASSGRLLRSDSKETKAHQYATARETAPRISLSHGSSWNLGLGCHHPDPLLQSRELPNVRSPPLLMLLLELSDDRLFQRLVSRTVLDRFQIALVRE